MWATRGQYLDAAIRRRATATSGQSTCPAISGPCERMSGIASCSRVEPSTKVLYRCGKALDLQCLCELAQNVFGTSLVAAVYASPGH
mmetsp:Transcript_43804/g.102244  ORF Transcript_43804/g.102244 Transcript_43804/m.102244 type:complete len:87 (+) Transcript_43804:522-782(+)